MAHVIATVALAMLVPLAITAAAASRGSTGGRFVATQLAAIIAVQLTVVLSMQAGVPYYADVALLLALVAVVASLLFARFLERWL